MSEVRIIVFFLQESNFEKLRQFGKAKLVPMDLMLLGVEGGESDRFVGLPDEW